MRYTAMGVLCVALFVFGCGGRTYYKNPNAPSVQEEKDYSECNYEAARATGNLPDNGERRDRVEDLVHKCMKARGYAPK